MGYFRERFKTTGPWLIVALVAITFYELLEHLDSVLVMCQNVISVLMPFIIGIALAWLLDIPTRKLQEKLIKNRVLAVLVVLVGVALAMWLLVAMVVPQVKDSASDFVSNISLYFENLMNLLEKSPMSDRLNIDNLKLMFDDWEHIWQQLAGWAESYSGSIFAYGKAIGQGVISAIVALAAMLFIMLDKDHLLIQVNMVLRAVTTDSFYKESLRIWSLADKMLSGFLMGKFADSVVIAIITAIVMMIFHMPLVALISVIVGITNMVPVVGPFIGGGIGGVIILLVSPKSLIPFLIMILAIQQLDGNIIGPKILGDRVGLPTIWTLFAIIVGGKLFGIVGMVLGVPIFAVIYTLVKEFVEKQLTKKGAIELLEQSGIQTLDEMVSDGSSESEDKDITTGQAEAGTDADMIKEEAPITDIVQAEAVATEAILPEEDEKEPEETGELE